VRGEDGEFGRMASLRDMCYRGGSPRACIRFGFILGQNRERQAQWRRSRPDFYDWQ